MSLVHILRAYMHDLVADLICRRTLLTPLLTGYILADVERYRYILADVERYRSISSNSHSQEVRKVKTVDRYGLPLLGISVASLALMLSFPVATAHADECTDKACTYWNDNGDPSAGTCQRSGSFCKLCNNQEQVSCKN
jgi:hypothetical protein